MQAVSINAISKATGISNKILAKQLPKSGIQPVAEVDLGARRIKLYELSDAQLRQLEADLRTRKQVIREKQRAHAAAIRAKKATQLTVQQWLHRIERLLTDIQSEIRHAQR